MTTYTISQSVPAVQAWRAEKALRDLKREVASYTSEHKTLTREDAFVLQSYCKYIASHYHLTWLASTLLEVEANKTISKCLGGN